VPTASAATPGPTAGRWGVRRWRDDQDGSMTPFILSLVLALGLLALFTYEVWKVYNEWQALSNRANSAAIAGASGIDEQAYRRGSRLLLDPARAEALAWRNLRAQRPDPALSTVRVAATPAAVRVIVTGRVPVLGVYRVTLPLTATATPMRGAP
jgi:hypothetical protein